MTRSTGVRLYRACLRCRQRKIKCDLWVQLILRSILPSYIHHRRRYTEGGTHGPCSKCILEGHQCMPATSRRGGDYSRFRGRRHGHAETQPPRVSEHGETKTELQPSALHAETVGVDNDTLFRGGVRNPLEALQILAQTAATAGDDSIPSPERPSQRSDGTGRAVGKSVHHNSREQPKASIMATEIIKEGIIDELDLEPLVQ